MEQSPWKAKRSSASQEISLVSCNLAVNYCMHKRPPHIPILSQIKPSHVSITHFFKIHFNINLPWTRRSSGLFPSGVPTKCLYVCTCTVFHTCCIPLPSHWSCFYRPNIIWWSVQIINLAFQSFPLPCYLVHLRPEYLPQHAILEQPQRYVPLLVWETKSCNHINDRQNYSSVYLDICIFAEQTGRQTTWHQMIESIPDLNLLWISSWKKFWFVRVVSKYTNSLAITTVNFN
jgi:hypothetical protein